ncbi:MAG: hypothetical protein Kow0029_05020 [Candidatus Rifleibacteriota bacterium]
MNVGTVNQSLYNRFARTNRAARNEASISLAQEGRRMNHTGFKKDDIVSQFWSLTNSMPKENQISLAASVMASKMFNQEVTPETKNFMQNLSNRFSPDEIGALKIEIRNHPMVRDKSLGEIEKFMNQLDSFISSQQSTQLENLQKQQANPKFRSPEEIFFQTTFNTQLFNQTAAV